jgi:hypothetical protein
METKTSFCSRMDAQIREVEQEVAELRSRLDGGTNSTRERWERVLRSLEAMVVDVRQRLEEVDELEDGDWSDLKASVVRTWADLSFCVQRTKSRMEIERPSTRRR